MQGIWKAQHRIAGETEEMFHGDGSRVFDLTGSGTKKLGDCGSSHRAGTAHLALASHLGTRNGCIRLDQGADQSSGFQRPDDLGIGYFFLDFCHVQ